MFEEMPQRVVATSTSAQQEGVQAERFLFFVQKSLFLKWISASCSLQRVVFPDPSEAFVARVQNHPAVVVPRLPAGFNLPNPESIDRVNEKGRGDTKDHPLSQWFLNFSEPDELLKLATARQETVEPSTSVSRPMSHLFEAKLRRQGY